MEYIKFVVEVKKFKKEIGLNLKNNKEVVLLIKGLRV